jgi:alpha(1,3/1,4) fucosyltransferase
MPPGDVLKIKFVDFWPGFDPRKNYFTDLLGEICEFEHSETPNLLFFGCYGNEHIRYRCHKIFYASENMRPSFRACDYSVGFDHIENPRHLRLPHYMLYGDPQKLVGNRPPAVPPDDRRFCCFVVSNGHAKERIEFYQKLNARRPVDSGGKLLNNIGGPVRDKRAFLRGYRFTIAFENSSFPGYTTEKIFEPMLEGSIPIYWGNPKIAEEFNPKSFINVHDYPNFDEAIEAVLRIDADPNLYAQMLHEPKFRDDRVPEAISRPVILDRFRGMLADKRLRKPVSATPVRHLAALEDKMKQVLYWLSISTGIRKHFR